MRLRMGELKSVIREALTPAMTQEFVHALQRQPGASVKLDNYGGMTNVFVTRFSGDAEKLEDDLTAIAERHGWSLLSGDDKRGPTWWFEPKPDAKGPIPRKRVPSKLYHVTRERNLDGIMSQGWFQATGPHQERFGVTLIGRTWPRRLRRREG